MPDLYRLRARKVAQTAGSKTPGNVTPLMDLTEHELIQKAILDIESKMTPLRILLMDFYEVRGMKEWVKKMRAAGASELIQEAKYLTRLLRQPTKPGIYRT